MFRMPIGIGPEELIIIIICRKTSVEFFSCNLAVLFLARLLILIKKGGLLQLKFGVVGVGVNIYLWAR